MVIVCTVNQFFKVKRVRRSNMIQPSLTAFQNSYALWLLSIKKWGQQWLKDRFISKHFTYVWLKNFKKNVKNQDTSSKPRKTTFYGTLITQTFSTKTVGFTVFHCNWPIYSGIILIFGVCRHRCKLHLYSSKLLDSLGRPHFIVTVNWLGPFAVVIHVRGGHIDNSLHVFPLCLH